MQSESRGNARRRSLLAAVMLCGAIYSPFQPAFAIPPLVQDYLHGVDALKELAAVPAGQQQSYRQQHAEELEAAARALVSADDVYRYTLAVNAAIVFKYGHAVICNYDEETGPRIQQLIDNHIARLVKSNVSPNEARRATAKLHVNELVLGEMLDEFGCPPESFSNVQPK